MNLVDLYAEAVYVQIPGDLFESVDRLQDEALVEALEAAERLEAAVRVVQDRRRKMAGSVRDESPLLAKLAERAGTAQFAAAKGDYEAAHELADRLMVRCLLEIRSRSADARELARIALRSHHPRDRNSYYRY